MKNLIRHITVLIVISLAFSCSDDFLKDELKHASPEEASIVVSPDWVAQNYAIHCPDVGNAKFKVTNAPSWLKISSSSGQFTDGSATLNCKALVNPEFSEVGIYYAYLTLEVSGKGNLRVLIAYINEGNPVVETESRVTFGYYTPFCGFSVKNTGSGILLLSVSKLPEWLSIGYDSEIFSIKEFPTIVLTHNGEGFIPLFYNQTVPFSENLKGEIVLITNEKNKPELKVEIQAKARNNTANPENIKLIEGNITDAYYCKQTDILYLTTTQPNRLLAYDTKNRKITHTLPLNSAPNCFSLSEDGLKAIIGHNKSITSVNANNFSIIKTCNVGFNVFDIEWGVDNWCCYTKGQEISEFYSLQWMNLDTEETYITQSDNYDLFGKSLITKIPNQNYIVATRLSLTPSGIIVFNSQNRKFVKYFHAEINDFWFSSDGNYLFSWFNEIFSTSSFFTSSNDVSPVRKFSPAPSRIYWMDHHAASHNVWVLSASDFYPIGLLREITQYEDINYTRSKTYYYDDFYNGNPVQAHYVFANQAGTELIVIRNITNGVSWSFEFIPIDK